MASCACPAAKSKSSKTIASAAARAPSVVRTATSACTRWSKTNPDFLAGKRARKEALDALDPKLQRIAVKCDLCAGHQDYACVTACPVAAAFRVDPGRVVADPNRGG